MSSTDMTTLTREDVTAAILLARKERGLTWEAMGELASMSPVWTHSAVMGMNSMPAEVADRLAAALELPEGSSELLQECPTKLWDQAVPTDPLLYRLYEATQVYGPSIKALIHEHFGDGIMSAIDFDLHLSKVEDPKGDRVKLEMTGKFLAYKTW